MLRLGMAYEPWFAQVLPQEIGKFVHGPGSTAGGKGKSFLTRRAHSSFGRPLQT